jgi:hypothetical protein
MARAGRCHGGRIAAISWMSRMLTSRLRFGMTIPSTTGLLQALNCGACKPVRAGSESGIYNSLIIKYVSRFNVSTEDLKSFAFQIASPLLNFQPLEFSL